MAGGLELLGTMTLWMLMTILATTSTDNTASGTVIADENAGELARKTTVGELIDVLRLMADTDNNRKDNDSDDDDDDDDQEPILTGAKVRKSGTPRPKYDPGLKWIGLGKRKFSSASSLSSLPVAAAPIGTELFTDMRRFFDSAHKSLVRNRSSSMNKDEDEISARRAAAAAYLKYASPAGPAIKFDIRSKNGVENNGPKKSHYNPSLLWTGLGR